MWSLKRWGEYVAVVGTTLFIPLEVYELTEKISWLKITVLVINIAAVLYLLLSKRLFGIRGGERGLRGVAARGVAARGRGIVGGGLIRSLRLTPDGFGGARLVLLAGDPVAIPVPAVLAAWAPHRRP